MPRYLRRRALAIVLGVVAVAMACVVVSTTNRLAPVPPDRYAQLVRSPFRAHLTNGSVIVFARGATVRPDSLFGTGTLYTPTLAVEHDRTYAIAMDSILGLEAFQRQRNPGRSFLYGMTSVAASTAAALGAVVVLAVAIFGSCPTIYADSAGVPVLQAESFSYSIAPLLARRDVDRLDATPDADGVIRLDVRNEALETHYIDQLELLEVRHAPDEFALPAARAGIVALRNPAPLAAVRDAAGRNVAARLRAADESAFATDDGLLRRASDGTGDPRDHLDFSVARPAGRHALALLLRMRSSLLSTAVFYDHMLAHHGARALDWVGQDLAHITTVARVAQWYGDHFGLRVQVRDGDAWRPVVRLMDFGPAAWRTVAVVIPDVGGDTAHVRLIFTADEFRIDRLAATWEVRAVEPRAIAVTRVVDSRARVRDDVRSLLRADDDQELVTLPGDRFSADFDVGRSDSARTYFVAADGYYVEWLRGSWIRSARDTLPFSTRTDVRDVLRTWVAAKDSLERSFFRDRVPIP